MVNYRSHKSYIPALPRDVDITLSESTNDLESVMTVMIPSGVTPRPCNQAYGDEVNTRFFGGKISPVSVWQFNYAERYLPAQKNVLKTADQRLTLMHAVKSLALTGKMPIVTKLNPRKKQFCNVQSFKTSTDDDFLNRLDCSSSGSPLILLLSRGCRVCCLSCGIFCKTKSDSQWFLRWSDFPH